ADPHDGGPATGTATVLAAPAFVLLPVVDRKGKLFIKIVDVHQLRVVTVIELLSPANKSTGPDGDAYLAKRQEYLASLTNLVAMDFLRTGRRPPTAASRPAADYYIIVSQAID